MRIMIGLLLVLTSIFSSWGHCSGPAGFFSETGGLTNPDFYKDIPVPSPMDLSAAIPTPTPCAPTACLLAVTNAQTSCLRSTVAAGISGLITNFTNSSKSGDMKRTCESAAGISELGAVVNAAFAASCGLKALAAWKACSADVLQCSGTCTPTAAACVTAANSQKPTILLMGGMAALSAAQSIKNLATFAKSKTCERAIAAGEGCKTVADYSSKPSCRFALCPNVTAVEGLTSAQIDQRILTGLSGLSPTAEISAATRAGICTVAARNCNAAAYRDDAQCVCEREPTREGCGTAVAQNPPPPSTPTTSLLPPPGGGFASGGPRFGTGDPTSGPNSTSNSPGFDVPGGNGSQFNNSSSNRNNRGNSAERDAVYSDRTTAQKSAAGGSGGGASGSGGFGGSIAEGGQGSAIAAGSAAGEGIQEGDGFSSSGGGGGYSSGGGSAGIRFPSSYGVGGKAVNPGIAGMAVSHGTDSIGVAGDDMFLMVHRKIQKMRTGGQTLETANPPVVAPVSSPGTGNKGE